MEWRNKEERSDCGGDFQEDKDKEDKKIVRRKTYKRKDEEKKRRQDEEKEKTKANGRGTNTRERSKKKNKYIKHEEGIIKRRREMRARRRKATSTHATAQRPRMLAIVKNSIK